MSVRLPLNTRLLAIAADLDTAASTDSKDLPRAKACIEAARLVARKPFTPPKNHFSSLLYGSTSRTV